MQSNNIKILKPRNLLLIFDILAIGMLIFYDKTEINKNIAIMTSALIILLYLSNILLEKVTSGDHYIFLIVSMLLSIGVIINFSIDQYFGFKHILWSLLGIVAFYGTYFILKISRKWYKLMNFYIALSLLLFILTLAIGKEFHGSKNWIIIGDVISFQPSEFIKILLIFIIGSYYTNIQKYKDQKNAPYILMAIVYIFIGFLFVQRDMGSAVLFLAIYTGLQFIFEEKRSLIWINVFLVLAGVFAGYLIFPHVRVRFNIWLDPWVPAAGQILESLIAMASGGFFGSGIGLGYPKFIPVVNSDFIFAAICEEMGMFVGIGVIMLFMLLVYRGLKIALVQRNTFYRIIAIGVSISFGVQIILALGGVTKFIPMTGITLPFVSYGGSSMIASFISLAILQAASEEFEQRIRLEDGEYE
ncbi:MAG: FtsW/RodA/SpoVE family cell cycle protein [Tissierellia bacterium]|nr:FtsW/RodA/SpoVE family cell cycle protein [Tissierellia bacterium]